MKMFASIRAAAAYAAIAPPAFPAEGAASFVTPSSFAIDTAHDMPRALNVPVGFWPSSFTQSLSTPSRSPSRGVGRSGV